MVKSEEKIKTEEKVTKLREAIKDRENSINSNSSLTYGFILGILASILATILIDLIKETPFYWGFALGIMILLVIISFSYYNKNKKAYKLYERSNAVLDFAEKYLEKLK